MPCLSTYRISIARCSTTGSSPISTPFVVLRSLFSVSIARDFSLTILTLQKGGVPAAPSGTATLLRLSPSY